MKPITSFMTIEGHSTLKIHQVEKPKTELWKSKTIETKGLSQAIKWLNQNIPTEATPIKELIKKPQMKQASQKNCGNGNLAFHTARRSLLAGTRKN